MSKKGKTGKKGKPYLTTSEVSRQLGIRPRTIRDLAKKGRLPTLPRFGGEGHYRYPREQIKQIATQCQAALEQQTGIQQTIDELEMKQIIEHLDNLERDLHPVVGKGLFTPG